MLLDPLSTPDATAGFPRGLGEFTLHAELGRGGSGVVYAALWGHREIALKVLHPDQTATDKFREQFLVEARRLSELAHPGVVKVLAVGVIDNRPYLAMERLLGETLAERLTRGALALPMAMDLAQQLAAAVAAMHARNLVHRDLKPENVFLVDAQHVVLLDFGIAKDLFSAPSTTTQDGGIRGTPAYMAPERFFGQAAGVATDVYELAVVVYAMIAARLPWDSLTDPAARLDPKPLVEAPPAIDVLLRTAMSTRAANRPVTVTQFAAQLRISCGDDDVPPHETQPLPAQGPEAGSVPNTSSAVAQFTHGTTLPLPAPTSAGPTPGAWFTRVTTPSNMRVGERSSDARKSVLDARPVMLSIAKLQPKLNVAAPSRKTRFLRSAWAGGLTLIVVVSGGVLWWQLRDRPGKALSAPRVFDVAMLPTTQDPWNVDSTSTNQRDGGSSGSAGLGGPSAVAPTKPAGPGAATTNQASIAAELAVAANIAKAVTRVPHGTSIIATASLLGWRGNADAMRVIDVAMAKPALVATMAAMPTCVQALIRHAQWVVVSAKSRGMADGYVVQIGGVESVGAAQSCLASKENSDQANALNGQTRGTWAGLVEGTLLWKDQILLFSSYRTITAAKVWAAGRDFGLVGRGRELYSRVQPEAAFALVADMPDGPAVEGLPPGTDVVVSLGLPAGKVVVELSAETRTLADAEALEARGKAQVATMLGASNELINIAVSRQANVVRLHGKLPAMILHVVANALADTK